MAPAQQGFRTGDALVEQVLLGLVVQFQLLKFHRAMQLAFQRKAHRQVVRQRVRVELHAIATCVLGAVHRPIGIPDEIDLAIAIVGKQGDADARRQKQILLGKAERPREQKPHFLCDTIPAQIFVQIDQQHEFVATRPGDQIACPNRFRQSQCDLL